MHDEHQVPIWFFIGCLLLVYGVLITGAGLFHLVSPVPPDQQVTLYKLHADLWWGALMVAVGLFYAVRYRPDGAGKPEQPGHSSGLGA